MGQVSRSYMIRWDGADIGLLVNVGSEMFELFGDYVPIDETGTARLRGVLAQGEQDPIVTLIGDGAESRHYVTAFDGKDMSLRLQSPPRAEADST